MTSDIVEIGHAAGKFLNFLELLRASIIYQCNQNSCRQILFEHFEIWRRWAMVVL